MNVFLKSFRGAVGLGLVSGLRAKAGGVCRMGGSGTAGDRRLQGDGRGGFSLVEVSLAIFVVALGMLTLFSLFPAGLNQAISAQEETQQALFAEYLFAEMREAIPYINDNVHWNSLNNPPNNPDVFNIYFPDFSIDGVQTELNWPVSGRHVRYLIEMQKPAGADMWQVSLWVASGQFGTSNAETFKDGASAFYTELIRTWAP